MSLRHSLSPGMRHEVVHIVSVKDTAKHIGSGSVLVLSTPVMIAWMEGAALELASKGLPEGYTTVGIHVDVYHKAPAPVGTRVIVEAELLKIEGKRLVFKVRARSGSVVIGEGVHERYIVDENKIRSKIDEIKSSIEIMASNNG